MSIGNVLVPAVLGVVVGAGSVVTVFPCVLSGLGEDQRREEKRAEYLDDLHSEKGAQYGHNPENYEKSTDELIEMLEGKPEEQE